MRIEICRDCGKKYRWSSIGGGVPGGKEVETVDCPHCGNEQFREMTSASFYVTAVDEDAARVVGG